MAVELGVGLGMAVGVGVGERVAVGKGVEVGAAVAVASGVDVEIGVGTTTGSIVAVDIRSAVSVGTGVTVGEGAGVAVATRAAVKVGVGTLVGSVAGVAVGRSTAVVPVGGGVSDVAPTSVTTITVASTVGAVVGVEIGAGVGWPPVQARAARVIIARNTRATGFIYQLLVSSQSQQTVPDHRDIGLGHTIPVNSLVQAQINRFHRCRELLPFGPVLDPPRDEISVRHIGQTSPVRGWFMACGSSPQVDANVSSDCNPEGEVVGEPCRFSGHSTAIFRGIPQPNLPTKAPPDKGL